ncbi:MAG: hypothetical protein QW594_03480 [Candidatus Woesearchaeota archaeon]
MQSTMSDSEQTHQTKQKRTMSFEGYSFDEMNAMDADEIMQLHQQKAMKSKEEFLATLKKKTPQEILATMSSQLNLTMLVDLGLVSFSDQYQRIKYEPTLFERLWYYLSSNKEQTYTNLAWKKIHQADPFLLSSCMITNLLTYYRQESAKLEQKIKNDQQRMYERTLEYNDSLANAKLLLLAAKKYDQKIEELHQQIKTLKDKLRETVDYSLEEAIIKSKTEIREIENKIKIVYNKLKIEENRNKAVKKIAEQTEEIYKQDLQDFTYHQAMLDVLDFYQVLDQNNKELAQAYQTTHSYEQRIEMMKGVKELISALEPQRISSSVNSKQLEQQLQELWQVNTSSKKSHDRQEPIANYVQEMEMIVHRMNERDY